jgi:HlyD family secretion protein
MATVSDLGKLRIDRDAPPPAVKRALVRAVWLAAAAVGIVGAVLLWLRGGSATPVQVVTASLSDGGAGAGGAASRGGATVGIVANGYVVARTKAAVSAKIPGRIATLGVSEGSQVRQGEVIARLDNADYAAAVAEAEAQLASARATLIELQADRDQMERELQRVRDIRAKNQNLVSQQDVETADSRAQQTAARVRAQEARVDAAGAALRFAQANF